MNALVISLKYLTANATAIDGDSLRLGDREIRLVGIDAPELFQICRNEQHGGVWPGGAVAAVRVSVSRHGRLRLQGAGSLRPHARDLLGWTGRRYRRGHGSRGYTVNFMSGGYRAAEASARAEKRGIWRGAFEQPHEWRRRNARSD